MADKHSVDGDQYCIIDRKMSEIKRQLTQSAGSPLAPEAVEMALQLIVEGRIGGIPALSPRHKIEVENRGDLAEVIGAAGFEDVDCIYERLEWSDWKSAQTGRTPPAPKDGSCEKSVKLFQPAAFFGNPLSLSNEQVQKGLEELSLRDANIRELIAFGAQYGAKPHIFQFPILAMGTTWSQKGPASPRIAMLHPEIEGFTLSWNWNQAMPTVDTRILVVSK